MKDNLFNSAEDFVKSIRKKSKNKDNEQKMLFRLGYTFIKRQTWDDARTVFLEILKNNPNYSFAWRYLGLALMRLENYESAEEALSEANLLDIDNAENWGFLTLFCLKVGRKSQALECLNELFKTDYQNPDIIYEIGEHFSELKEYMICDDIFNRILTYNPLYSKAVFALSHIYYQNLERQSDAIDILNNFYESTENEHDKSIVRKFIDNYTGKNKDNFQFSNNMSSMNSVKNNEDESGLREGLYDDEDEENFEDSFRN
jgi:tetratricopeptide (TPR) repeat protein